MGKYAKVKLLESLAAELNRRARTIDPSTGHVVYSDAPWRAWIKRARELFDAGDGIRRLYPVHAIGLPKGDTELRDLLARMAWSISDANVIVLLNVAARDVLNGKAKP